MKISTICVCGAGTMGSGIAQVAATAGFRTILYEVNEAVLQHAKSNLQNNLQKLVEKQKIPAAEKENIWQRLQFTNSIQDCVGDVVIEAIIEQFEAKVSLFNQVAAINATTTLFASNTSSLSVSEIARHLPNPGRVAGLHFFNPAPVMKLVEVVKGELTSHTVVNILVNLVTQMGKIPVVCKDAPGFIVNRVARPFYLESLRLAEEGQLSFEIMDRLLESKGFKMGPFKLMDLIGNDINYTVSCSVYKQLQEPERLKPSPIQKQKVEQGELGKKTGKGYYSYTPNL